MILERGAYASSAHLTLRYLPSPESENRFSCVAPRKAFSRATKRVMIRRRGRAALASLWPKLKKPFIGLVLAKSGADKIDVAAFRSEMASLFVRAGLVLE